MFEKPSLTKDIETTTSNSTTQQQNEIAYGLTAALATISSIESVSHFSFKTVLKSLNDIPCLLAENTRLHDEAEYLRGKSNDLLKENIEYRKDNSHLSSDLTAAHHAIDEAVKLLTPDADGKRYPEKARALLAGWRLDEALGVPHDAD